MSIIHMDGLCKHFRVLNRRSGLRGSMLDLFSGDFKSIKAVDEISLDINEGEIVGFLGPNGAGKSTTIKMLTGVLQPTSGTVDVCGFQPFKQRRKYVRHIGVVFGQRTQLWWDIPVIESFKLLKSIYGIETDAYIQTMGLFNDLVHLDKLYSTPVRQLSLGQRMLCDIAASFLHNPKVIFLDEPTIGLDVVNKGHIRTIIRDLNAARKTTVLLTSHDVGDIENLCRRIIMIDKGTLVYDGDIERFNTMFGAWRTLQLECASADHEKISAVLQKTFPDDDALNTSAGADGWIDVTVNQDKAKLADVLSVAMREFSISDVKIREIALENVIRRVYQEAERAHIS